jgi:hypothetical protein
MENIMTNYVLDVDLIVKILSFVCFPKVKQPCTEDVEKYRQLQRDFCGKIYLEWMR